jgi:tricorn protease interacting factor F2/3
LIAINSRAPEHKTLGKNVVPVRYWLELEPNLKNFKFNGTETIEVKIKERTNAIRLNSSELRIKEAYIQSGSQRLRAHISINGKAELLVLKFNRDIAGNAKITIRFSGVNNDKLHGFYRSKYLDGRKEKFILTTQFEPSDARKCFPCFDEPELKASFNLSLIVDKELDCISNTPAAKVAPLKNNKKRVSFTETLRMSTYLLYIGVGEFEYTRGRVGKTRTAVINTKGKKSLAAMPLRYAEKFLKFYNDYFEVKYPLPKLDLLSIPDFAAGAMENWGAITFRETALLGDKNTSIAARQGISEVVAHEIAHQWFGDLVTMKWWDDLWLNESFATFMSYKAVAYSFPKWAIGDQMLADTLDSISSAFAMDQLRATHPISTKVADPKEIAAIFDNISYDKGASLLHMIEDYTGRETFRRGLHLYLKRYAYSNATKYDLWNAIDAVAKKHNGKGSVGSVASYWIDTPGYPVVYVKKTRRGIRLSQRRFLLSSTTGPTGHWPVPVHYATGGGKEGMFLLTSPSEELDIALQKGEFIKLNRGQKGLYRVWYDKELLTPLGQAIKKKKISSVDAWGIENDLFTFARSGKLPVRVYLFFISKYCSHGDYPLNENVLSHLNLLYVMLYNTALSGEVMQILNHHCHILLDRLGLERKKNEKSSDTLMRGGAFASLGFMGDEEIIEKARSMFEDFVKNKTPIEPNLKSAVMSTVARNGDEKRFDQIKRMYIAERVPEDKIRFLAVLAQFPSKRLIARALSFALSRSVRYQDAELIPAVASSNPLAEEALWKWTSNNWRTLQKRYPAGTMMLKRFVSNLSMQRDSETKKKMVAFFRRKDVATKDIASEVSRTLEKVEANIRLMRLNGLSDE